MKKTKLLLAAAALMFGGSVWAQSDVTSDYITNADFEGTYTSAYTINTNRYVYQPDGWTVDYKNESTWNMTVVGSTDAMASNFTGTYAVPADNQKYMVRFRDNKPSEYVDLSQTITVTESGIYTFSADLIRENGSKINVELYAGDTKVANSSAGTWENRSFSVALEAGTEIKVGIKFTNLAADGVKAGADNVKISYTAFVDPTAITLNNTSLSMIPTAKKTLSVASYTPAGANHNLAITWSSSDGGVATVSSEGQVTAVAPGTATITATTANDKTATCEVTVNEAPVAEGDYYILNVSKDKYLGGANSWGSQASIIEHGIPIYASLANGVYKLNTRTYNNDTDHFIGLDAGSLFMDNAGTGLYFTSLGSGKYSISTNEGSGYLTANNDNTVVANSAENASDELAQWKLFTRADLVSALASATTASPVDATFYIADPNFSRNYWPAGRNTSSWTMVASNKNLKGGNNDNMCAESYHSTFTLSQVLTVPNGQYKLRAQACENVAEPVAVIYANEETAPFKAMANSESGMGDCSTQFSAGNYYTDWITVNITDNTLTVGAKSTSASNWCVWDNFELYYYGQNLAEVAEELPVTTMTADKWYYFDIAVDGDYDLTLTTLSDIVYTTDGTILLENVSSVDDNFSGTDVISLTAGRYYVKSASAQSFAVAPHAYSYAVGDATMSVADGGYTQSSTFTVTFPSASTNDPSGETALVALSTATVNGNSVSLSSVDSGFSLDLGSLTTNSNYRIVIPAEVYGYSGESMNEEIDITIHTPAAFDGFYFLRTSAGKYVARGGDYNSRAVVDEFGLPLSVTTDAAGVTQFTYVDNGGKLFLNGDGNAYTDNITDPDWTFEATEGGYYLVHANGTYANKKLNVWSGDSKSLYATGTEGAVFVIEPVSEHNTYMEALKDAQAATAATAYGNDAITTKADLATWLAANYDAVPVSVPSVSFTEKWSGDASAEWGAGKDMYTNTISSLPEGLYKLTVNAYYRINGSATAAEGARGNTYLYGGSAKTQLYSLKDFPAAEAWSGRNQNDAAGYYPDDVTSGTAATTSSYLTELYVYHAGGDFTYGIHQPSRFSNGEWFGYQNFTLTRYAVVVSSAGYATYANDQALDFTDSGIQAYIAKTKGDGTGVTFTRVYKVPANTGVLLYKDGGATENIPVFDGVGAADVKDNVFVRGTGAGVVSTDGTNYNYILNDGASGVGFYKANGKKVATNRAYISVTEAPAGIKEFISLDLEDAPDGISLTPALSEGEEAIYNVAGQRMNKVQKGINIVNGKKVLF